MREWVDRVLMPKYMKLDDWLDCVKVFVLIMVSVVFILSTMILVPRAFGIKFELCSHQYVPAREGTLAMCAKCAKVVELELKK